MISMRSAICLSLMGRNLRDLSYIYKMLKRRGKINVRIQKRIVCCTKRQDDT